MPASEHLSGLNISLGDLPNLINKFFGEDGDMSYAEEINKNNKRLEELSSKFTSFLNLEKKVLDNNTEVTKIAERISKNNSKEYKIIKDWVKKNRADVN
jgi:hypothetical protein